jgi:hypothetical protein
MWAQLCTCGSSGASSYSNRIRPGAGIVATGMVTIISTVREIFSFSEWQHVSHVKINYSA